MLVEVPATMNGRTDSNITETALKELEADRNSLSPPGGRTPNKSTTLIITGVHRVSSTSDNEAEMEAELHVELEEAGSQV